MARPSQGRRALVTDARTDEFISCSYRGFLLRRRGRGWRRARAWCRCAGNRNVRIRSGPARNDGPIFVETPVGCEVRFLLDLVAVRGGPTGVCRAVGVASIPDLVVAPAGVEGLN